MVAVDSQDQSSTNDVKLFEVTVVAEVRLSLSASVMAYATDADEAAEKVQGRIDDGVLDDDLEMEDWNGVTLPYGDLKYCDDIYLHTENVEVVEDKVDPADVLEAEVKELQASISWTTDAVAKHKAFLESMLNECDEEQRVAA